MRWVANAGQDFAHALFGFAFAEVAIEDPACVRDGCAGDVFGRGVLGVDAGCEVDADLAVDVLDEGGAEKRIFAREHVFLWT